MWGHALCESKMKPRNYSEHIDLPSRIINGMFCSMCILSYFFWSLSFSAYVPDSVSVSPLHHPFVFPLFYLPTCLQAYIVTPAKGKCMYGVTPLYYHGNNMKIKQLLNFTAETQGEWWMYNATNIYVFRIKFSKKQE